MTAGEVEAEERGALYEADDRGALYECDTTGAGDDRGALYDGVGVGEDRITVTEDDGVERGVL